MSAFGGKADISPRFLLQCGALLSVEDRIGFFCEVELERAKTAYV